MSNLRKELTVVGGRLTVGVVLVFRDLSAAAGVTKIVGEIRSPTHVFGYPIRRLTLKDYAGGIDFRDTPALEQISRAILQATSGVAA